MTAVYVVTDIEVNGPTPGEHSMLAFASVAVDHAGGELGSFEAVLETLPEAGEDPITIYWFRGFPAAWAAATTHPGPPSEVMQRYAAWLRGLARKSHRLTPSHQCTSRMQSSDYKQ